MLPTPAPSVATPHMGPPPAHETELSSVLYIHMSPYISEGWCHALHDSNTSHLFPLLVNDIIYGSPIGSPPPLATVRATLQRSHSRQKLHSIERESRPDIDTQVH